MDEPTAETVALDGCASCGESLPMFECPASNRRCGHHCNCSWIHDHCHWCGREFGEVSDPRIGDISIMESPVTHNNKSDEQGRPAGGCTHGRGFTIAWQDGPLGRGDDRIEPNGAFVEDVISAAIGRIEFYQASEFASEYNAKALAHLVEARASLRQRTLDREAREVEGTHEA
jgi:hypothetical protein